MIRILPARTRSLSAIALMSSAALVLCLAATSRGTESAQAKVNHYIGVQKCKTCHNSPASGDQYGAWNKMKHAKAFESLASDDAKKIAKEKGIADPQKEDGCIKCHVTAFGVADDQLAKGFDRKLGVQCETCHGPGEAHMKARFAAAASEGDEETAGDAKPKKYTQVPADEIIRDPAMATCLKCHNKEGPNFKPFCFYKNREIIQHLNPLKPRTAEERAKMLVCGCGEKCECVDGCADGKCGVAPKPPK